MTKHSSTLNLAFIQFEPVWENAEESLSKLTSSILKLSEVDVLVLPEAFATGFSMNAPKVAESMDGKSVSWMKETALKQNTAICGSVFIKENNQYFNRFIWVNPNGELVSYDKRHLFSMGEEHSNYTKGQEQVVISFKGWKIFPQVCYDVRFPVWSRNVQKYDLLLNVANWPAPRRKVWKTLLKARAIENQCYVVGVNRLGNDESGIDYSGDSLVVDAKGEILLNAKTKSKIQYYSLDMDSLHRFRSKFDTLKDADQFEIQD